MKTSSASANGAKRLRIKNILVPVDFSELSIEAISTAQRLGQRFGASIHLAHIQEYSYPAVFSNPSTPVYISPAMDTEEWRKAAEQALKTLAREYRLTGTCRAEVGGAPFDDICWIARQISADLIITSTHGRTGLKRALLGSTAERLVQHAPCPVLVSRKEKPRRGPRGKSATKSILSIDSILVPVDFSESSLTGLNYAIEFAKKFSARLLVLHVVDLGPLLGADTYAPRDSAASEEAAMRDAEQGMSEYLRRVKFGEVPFQTQMIAGGSVQGICQVAAAENVDLIITATHGRTGLTHVLIGSTAEVVVRHAPCPVLVVPSHPGLRAAGQTTRKASSKRGGKPRLPSPPRKTIPEAFLTRRARKIVRQPFPERRKTNKFRESHLGSLG
jgi:nucleotide-binding universal stress UspA family protein